MMIRKLWILLVLVLAACSPDTADNAITASELASRLQAGDQVLVLDVRTPGEFASGHIPGAVNIPHTELSSRLDEIGADRHREIVALCKSGGRAATAEKILEEAGYTNVRDLDGHMDGWLSSDLPVTVASAQ